LSQFLDDQVAVDGLAGMRTFYAETFSLCFFALRKSLSDHTRRTLLSRYETLDKNDSEFHWEFNNYALIEYRSISGDHEVLKYLKPLRFKGTECTNWTLLRSNARIIAGDNRKQALQQAKIRIKRFQLRTGLILDDPGVRSFPYHCFSLAMIAEIYFETRDAYFLESFESGLNFIRRFILSNGDTLYVGRGQEQSFGYAALIYVLSLGAKYLEDGSTIADLRTVCDFVLSFQRKDGSFPLVMNDSAPGSVLEEISKNRNLPGWYAYNNYYDYLAFMGYFLAKSLVVQASIPTQSVVRRTARSYQDSDFKKTVTSSYEAVVARPGGYWTNDLPMPYLVSRNHSLMPCYGGEQFAESVYSTEGLPLPFNFYFKVSLRTGRLFASFLRGDKIIAISLLGIMVRRFEFDEHSVTVTTSVWSYLKMYHTYLFNHSVSQPTDKRLEDDYLIVSSDQAMEYDSTQYSASGPLKRFRVSGRTHRIRIHLK
jgi:hypothetical protein